MEVNHIIIIFCRLLLVPATVLTRGKILINNKVIVYPIIIRMSSPISHVHWVYLREFMFCFSHLFPAWHSYKVILFLFLAWYSYKVILSLF